MYATEVVIVIMFALVYIGSTRLQPPRLLLYTSIARIYSIYNIYTLY